MKLVCHAGCTPDFCYRSESCHFQEFSDVAILGCNSRGDESDYRPIIDDFVTWSELNHLQLNVTMWGGPQVNSISCGTIF